METEQDRPVIRVDCDVQAVLEFMQTRIAANRLVNVANGLAAIAPLLWGRYKAEAVEILQLKWPDPTPSDCDRPTQSVAIE